MSAESQIPIAHHFDSPAEPIKFEVEAEDDAGVLWRYVLHVTTKRVIHEALYRKQKRFNYVFVRDWNETTSGYEIKQQGFGFVASEAKKVRQNASLISTAVQYGVSIAQHVASSNVLTNLNSLGRQSFQHSHVLFASEFFAENEALRIKMIELLKSWDLGLNDIKLKKHEKTSADGGLEEEWVAYGVHKTKSGKLFDLRMELESSGTQSAFVLLSLILSVLESGGVALVDEMESDLHPLLVEPLLELFSHETTNPHNAQIIFTCHSMRVLDALQKAQVMFVEKNECESEAYRGDEIEGLRSDDNLRSKYETGALGAIPRI